MRDIKGGDWRRFAIYWVPEPGPLAAFGAAWLGWDAAAGREAAHPAISGLPNKVADLTAVPRKYGLHGTIKPPFRLAPGTDAGALDRAAATLAAAASPVTLDGLRIDAIGAFLALVPDGDTRPLAQLAARVVEGLDAFRAPPDAAEIARRNPDSLSERQRALLDRWGYPYVMGEFRFHVTLSGPLDPRTATEVGQALAPHLAPLLPRPFVLGALALSGEAPDGRFHILRRYQLGGQAT